MAPNVIFTASQSTSQATMSTMPSSQKTAFIENPLILQHLYRKAPGTVPVPIQYRRDRAASWTDGRRAFYSAAHARAARREETGRPLRSVPGTREMSGLRRLARHRGGGAGAPRRLVDGSPEPGAAIALFPVG